MESPKHRYDATIPSARPLKSLQALERRRKELMERLRRLHEELAEIQASIDLLRRRPR